MRIRQLEIEQFGIFADQTLVFPGDGLHVLFGPNEAGKTTLLQLIRELLFGFAVRNPYAFAARTGEMAAAATLELADGRELRFRRRKGRRGEVVGEYRDSGQSIDAVQLNRLLGGAGPELFQNVFGFSLAELSAGQQSLEHANLSEALYGGALGGLAGFRQLLEALEKEHEALFSPSATKRPVNQLLAELRRQGKELRAIQVRPREFQLLEKDVQDLGQQVEQIRQERDALQRRQSRCGQLLQALALWRQRALLLEELEGLVVPPEFPRDGQQQLDQHLAVRNQAALERDEFQQELADVGTQLASLSPHSELMDQAGTIRQLAQQLDKIRGFRRDIVLRQQESQAVKTAVLAALHELDPSWTLDHLQQFQIGVARDASILAMQEELQELQQRERDLLAQRPAIEADIDTMKHQLEVLPDVEPDSPLVELVELAAAYETRREKLEQTAQQLRDVQSRQESLQKKLKVPCARHLEQVDVLPVPMLATVTEFRQQRAEIQQRLERRMLRFERARADADALQQELHTLQAEEHVPDMDQLKAARARRDRGWHLVRRAYVDGEAVSEQEIRDWSDGLSGALPDAYEQSVRDADQIADQRQQQAEVVARLDQLTRQLAQAQQACQQEEQAHASCAAEKEAWRKQWHALWQPCGMEPEGPEAMADWLRLHAELVDTVAQADSLQGHQHAQQQWIRDYEARLAALLGSDASAPARQIAEARRRMQQAQETVAERKSYVAQLPRKQQQLAMLQQELAELRERRGQWQTRWQQLMEEFGFPVTWDVHTVTKVLSGLSDARARQREAESLDVRVGDMRAGLEQFQREVFALCEATAPSLRELPAENAVETLVEMLDRTRQELRDQQRLLQEKAKYESRCEAKQKQVEKEQAGLNRLLQLAGLEREEELPELARRAQRWYDTRDAIEMVEHQLRTVRGEEDPSEFEAALSAADETELVSQQQILQTERERIEDRFAKALQDQGVAVQRLQDLEQAAQAVALLQDMESTRSQLAETVDRWVPLVFARALMLRAMEKFQREHQPHLLVDVGRLLQRMTMGRYTEVSRKLDEQGSLQVHEANGQYKEPHQLSTGTREQLYLAVRLAYVLHYCREAEPLPIVMDDVLVNFDDQRAAATLDALIEVSRHVQVMLLTCHQFTVDLLRSRSPDVEPILLHA